MAKEAKYRVIITGMLRPERARDEVVANLAALFHSRPATVQRLLQGKPTALTKQYERAAAEKICRAVLDAGAECQLEEIADEAEAAVKAAPGGERRRDDSASDAARESEPQARGKHPEQLAAILQFVGTNREYYARQFAKFGSVERPRYRLTWHWPSALAFFLWAFYRKLWVWGGVNLLGAVALAWFFPLGLVHLAWAVIWPLLANFLYYRHARAAVLHGARGLRIGGVTLGGGGVSVGGLVFGVTLMGLVFNALNEPLAERAWTRLYGEELQAFMPAPGSRLRGDGSAIDDIAGLPSDEVSTLNRLGLMAAALRKLADGDGSETKQNIFAGVADFVQRGISDSWGNRIVFRRDEGGQLVLRSSGRDGVLDTADDIVQMLALEEGKLVEGG